MTTTLLAVDDSRTMRRVLEITFSGEPYRTLLAESAEQAKGMLGERPTVALVDAGLPDGAAYELCRAIKQSSPGTSVLMLTHKAAPLDKARGATVGVDDSMDKPFDTQQLLDRVATLLRKGPSAAAPTAAAPAPTPSPAAARVAPAAPAPAAAPAQERPRAQTLSYGAAVPAPAPAPARTPQVPSAATSAVPPTPATGTPVARPAPAVAPAPAPVVARPVAPAPAAPVARPAAPVAPAAAQPAPAPQRPVAPAAAAPAESPLASAVAAKVAPQLQPLGLTPAQVEAVLALSKSVVEQVVWEVVPVLAETLIKEEIRRLTRE
ncbi:MAG: response regulator transcription factor [Polyangiaceae bacterium]|nr:response regulator transcription factor [Polyangiaceae bacterium]